MSSLFRRPYRDKKTGEVRRSKVWTGQWTDAAGVTRRKSLSANKAVAEKMLADLVRAAEMGKAGLIDPFAEHAASPVAVLLDEFGEHQSANGLTGKQVTQVRSRCNRTFAGCGFAFLRDLDGGPVERWLADRMRTNERFGVASRNHFVNAVKAFGNWLVTERKVRDNPFRFLKKLNGKADVRKVRRVLSPDEFARLVAATEAARVLRTLTGPARAVLYTASAYTGLRASELASLVPGSFALDADPPTLTVEAAFSKSRRRDVVPLHPALAAILRPFLAGKPAGVRVWPGNWADDNAAFKLIRSDLRRARKAWLSEVVGDERAARERTHFLAYKDAAGRTADFHSLRHRFVTELVKAEVAPKDAKFLARHSSIILTMDYYAHVEVADTVDALAKLSVPGATDTKLTQNPRESAGSGGSGREQVADATGVEVRPKLAIFEGNEEYTRQDLNLKPSAPEADGTSHFPLSFVGNPGDVQGDCTRLPPSPDPILAAYAAADSATRAVVRRLLGLADGERRAA